MRRFYFLLAFLAAIAVALESAIPQTRDKPLAAEPPRGKLSCGQTVFVRNPKCPGGADKGIEKVVGACGLTSTDGARKKSCLAQ